MTQDGVTQGPSFDFVGSEQGPVVVLAHALGGDRTIWDRQLPALAASYRVLRYDLPGHGTSPEHVGPLSLEDLAGDVLSLIDRHGIERVHFCGLSLGGLIGQWLGLHAQDRLRSLTLVDSALTMGSVQTWNDRIDQIEREGLSSVSIQTMGRWFTESFRAAQPSVVAHFREVLERMSPTAYIACAKVVRDASEQEISLEQFKTIRVPTFVITGTFDSAARPDACKEMASHIPGSHYGELHSAHISPVEADQAFTKAFVEFLDAQPRCH